MSNAVIELKGHGFLRKFLIWQKKRRNDQLIRVNGLHEQTIRVLQQRYGYSRQEATSQLDKTYSKAWLG